MPGAGDTDATDRNFHVQMQKVMKVTEARRLWGVGWGGGFSHCPVGKTVQQTQATLFELSLAPRSQTQCHRQTTQRFQVVPVPLSH